MRGWKKISIALLSLWIFLSVLGGAFNFTALAFNDWKMPVSISDVSWNVEGPLHKQLTEHSRLKLLCDIFPIKDAQGKITGIQSIGDILMCKIAPIFLIGSYLFFLIGACLFKNPKHKKQ